MTTLFSETTGQGQDLVFIHGWGLHSDIWHDVVASLVDMFRVTIVDLPGYGRSPMSADYTLSGLISELVKVVPESAIYIGWSLGGVIATKLARHYPERVKKLIKVASSPRFLKDTDWPGIESDLLLKFAKQ